MDRLLNRINQAARAADRILEIVKLLVVSNIVDSVGGEVLADISGAGSFTAAPERIL